jgi:hypothetical protein
LEPKLKQSIKSTNEPRHLELPAAIARSFTQLKLARSQSLLATTDLSTAAIDYQIELRDTILYHLAEVRSDLARQLFGNAPRNRSLSANPNRKNITGSSARRLRRLNLINRKH